MAFKGDTPARRHVAGSHESAPLEGKRPTPTKTRTRVQGGRTGRRWDDTIQRACDNDGPWQQEALDKAAWSLREEEFLSGALGEEYVQDRRQGALC